MSIKKTELYATVTRSLTAKASERSTTFTASTQSLDRGSDRILGPWQLAAFRKNPVILFAHDYKSLPIGRATSISVDGSGNLIAVVEFATLEQNPQADMVYNLYLGRYLRAVSVGFRPIDSPTYNEEGGLDYKSVELLEISCVPVPANPDALRKSLVSHAGDVSESRARQIIEAAFDRAGLAAKNPSVDEATARCLIERAVDVGEVAAFLKQLDRLDDSELRALAASL